MLSESLDQTYVIQPLELPGNGRIFFLRSTSLDDLNHDIYSVRPDGGGLSGVVTDPTNDQLVAISPDGSRAVYAAKPVEAPASDFELYLDVPGERIQLTNNDRNDNAPAWSPDGRSIAFHSDRVTGIDGIYTMNLASRTVFTVFRGDGAAGAPSFSPNGDELTFQYCETDQPCRIVRKRVDGTGDLFAVTNGTTSDTDPDWGPHGEIVFVRAGVGDQHGLFTIDPTDEAPTPEPLTTDSAYNADPAWSPDGTQVAYVTTVFGNGNFDLATISPESGDPVQVVDGGRNGFPDWQPVPIISSPVAGTNIDGIVTVRASAGDVLPITEIQFYYTDDSGQHSIADDTDPPFEASLDTAEIVGDDAIITARGSTNEGLLYENSIEVDLDRTPPETSAGVGPNETTTDTVALFNVTANEENVTFACELDGEPVEDCGGTEFFSGLGLGEHTFSAAATDDSGNTDDTPDIRAWTVLEAPAPDTTGETTRASLTNAGGQANGGSSTFPSISDDGNIVGFESEAINLTSVGSGERLQAYARNRSAGTTMMLSSSIPNPDGVQGGNANSGWVQVAGNGNSAVFQSLASNLACVAESCVPGTTTWHVYRRSLDAGSSQLVDAAGASIANGSSQHPAISADGRFVAFDTAATNLLPDAQTRITRTTSTCAT